MASADYLSRDEIQALLQGVDSGEINTATENVFDDVVRTFDFTNQERNVRGSMPTLEMINERFAHYFRADLFNMLRRTVEITVAGAKMVKFSEYMDSLFTPTCVNLLKINPLRGKALCVIDPKLVFIAVDNYFGGSGRHAQNETRDFSPIEYRVIQIILELAFKDLMEAWKPVLPVSVEFQSMEVNPRLANIVSPNEMVVICSFHVELDGGGGSFSVVMPYAMLEPIHAVLEAGVHSDRSEYAEHWRVTLLEELKTAEVTLSCTLAQARLRLRDLLSLKEGDMIPIDYPDKLTVMAEDVPVFRGAYGVHQGSESLKIQEIITHSDIGDENHTVVAAGVKE